MKERLHGEGIVRSLEEAQIDFHGRAIEVRKEKLTRRNPRLSKPLRFRSLHHHSTYSYLDGFQLPEAHVRRAAEINMDAIGMTEHGNVMSHTKLEKAAKAEGIKPVFGCELYCGAINEEDRSQRKNHLTILAENQEGYRNLLQLVTRSWEEGFYYEPTVDGAMLKQNKRGLIVMSGCSGSLLFTSLVGGKLIKPEDASYERGREVAWRFKRVFGDNYYLEIQAFPELPMHKQANGMIAQISSDLNIPLVASLDCHYTTPTEKEMQQVLHNIRGGARQTLEEQAMSWGYEVDQCPPLTDAGLVRRLTETGLSRSQALQAILATEEIASRCTVELPKLEMVRFQIPPRYKSRVDFWRDKIREGWSYRGLDSLSHVMREKYKARLQREAKVIEDKDFIDYFLIVGDAVQWAKDQGIAVGPARGSAAASLICWLLRITEIDPMKFPTLVFDRFIDETREDLPDIDIDFCAERRSEVRTYLVNKYGPDNVNNVGTFTHFKAKLSLTDIARVYRIPMYEVAAVKDLLIERSSGDLRASATIEDTAQQFEAAGKVFEAYPELRKAIELEGNVKGFGVHAAGLVISTDPITNVVPVMSREVRKRPITVVGIDKHDAEYLGLLKLDFLGLNTMTMLDYCCQMVGKDASFLYEIPLDDEETIEGFRNNDVVGVFQFDGRAVRTVNGSVRPDNFKEICDIIALARPGPLHNGAVTEYIDVKRGSIEPPLLHSALENITADTYYQIVYQEQILRIVREIGDFDWTHAAEIRRIISKKLGDARFNAEWERFWNGANRLHPDMPEEVARSIWGSLITAGSYSMNYAHVVSYGMLAFMTMWFKTHHPLEFYVSSLSKQSKGSVPGAGKETQAKLDRHALLLRDAHRHGIDIQPPDLKTAGITWSHKKPNTLLGGFSQIDGIGESKARSIIEFREHNGNQLNTWNDLLKVKGIGPKMMTKIKDFAESEDPFDIETLDKLIAKAKRRLLRLALPYPTHTAIEVPYERGQSEQVTWIGIVLHRNLRDLFERNRARFGTELKPEEVKRPDLNEWVIMAGYDGSEIVTLRVDRFRYPAFRDAVWGINVNHDLVLVRGIKPAWRTAREVYISRLWVLDPDEL